MSKGITDEQVSLILAMDEILGILQSDKEPLRRWSYEKAQNWIDQNRSDYNEGVDLLVESLAD